LYNAINFIKNQKYINKIIIGFEDLGQLKENYKIMKKNTQKIDYSAFSTNSINLIDPRRWNKIKILI
jgi:NADH/NAD ratio-sensing transcriptional regulator Rex